MSKMIEALDGRKNALLESPTGTGKTMSMIISSMGWLFDQHQKGKNTSSKIFVASRTHTQIKQLVKELKASSYKPIVSILASRNHLCVNRKLDKYSGVKKNNLCAALRQAPPIGRRTTFASNAEKKEYMMKSDSCQYDKNYRMNHDSFIQKYAEKIMDIEDLFDDAKENTCCPFYLGRDMLKPAHVVFLPYNYLLNDGFIDTIKDHIGGSVLIFDEAHNVSGTAEDCQSFKFESSTMVNATAEIKDMMKFVNKTQEPAKIFQYHTAGQKLIDFFNILA
jgi:regulator of telomere elongation helicase 1